MKRQIIFTRHAETVLSERGIERTWVERTLRRPDSGETDSDRGTLNAFCAIPEYGGRILRVTYINDDAGMRVITAFFDRRRRR